MCLLTQWEGAEMARRLLTFFVLTALICGRAVPADDALALPPKINSMDAEGAETVCVAWPEAGTPSHARPAEFVWVGLPAAVKPFGMRAYVSVDDITRPLRQIAYMKIASGFSIHYRTLGDRAYDVRIELSGPRPTGVEGADLAGTLTVSRFGLFSELKVVGSCGAGNP
jgi:hypothetical protein